MSFAFDWASFAHEDDFLSKCRHLLTDALNRSTPRIIEGPITIQDLTFGDEAPKLEMLEIGDVAADRFRGIFKLDYKGSATTTLATKVQANLLNVYAQTAPAFTTPKFVAAPVSLSIPLNLTLSDIQLSGIVIIVFSKARGLTLVFRNDPLASIKVSSTFDSMPGIASFLQTQIETQIRGLFREELPAILYRHSQLWTQSGQAELLKKAAESQHLQRKQALLEERRQLQELLSLDDVDGELDLDLEKPVTFAEIDEQKQVSLVNMLHLEAMAASRRTLGISTPTVATAVLRSELSVRSGSSEPLGPVTLAGEFLHEHIHNHADRIAANAKHAPRRRVIKLRGKSRKSEPHHDDTASEYVSLDISADPLPERSSSVPTIAYAAKTAPCPVRSKALEGSPSPALIPAESPVTDISLPPVYATSNLNQEVKRHDKMRKQPFSGASEHPPPAYFA